jgi:putative ABC transport system permease protein
MTAIDALWQDVRFACRSLVRRPGIVLGLIGALAAAHSLASLLYGISPADFASYALALFLLPAAALLGCWRPARRPASANPADIIREE